MAENDSNRVIVGIKVDNDASPDEVLDTLKAAFSKQGIEIPDEVIDSIRSTLNNAEDEDSEEGMVKTFAKAAKLAMTQKDFRKLVHRSEAAGDCLIRNAPEDFKEKGPALSIQAACDFVQLMAESDDIDFKTALSISSLLAMSAYSLGYLHGAQSNGRYVAEMIVPPRPSKNDRVH